MDIKVYDKVDFDFFYQYSNLIFQTNNFNIIKNLLIINIKLVYFQQQINRYFILNNTKIYKQAKSLQYQRTTLVDKINTLIDIIKRQNNQDRQQFFISLNYLMSITPQSNILTKNLRSHSILSQQNSKRTSLSTSNLNLYPTINSSPISHTKNQPKQYINPSYSSTAFHLQKQNQKQKFSQINPTNLLLNKNSTNAKSQTELLQKLKKQLIQPYRIIKKHTKENIFNFVQVELKEVYQGMSNSLKILEKVIQNLAEAKQRQTDRNPGSNSVITANSFMSIGEIPHNLAYLQKINSLQTQILQLKQLQSQQIRSMMQNHEQYMMFIQQQHKKQKKKLDDRINEYQNQIDELLKTHKKKEEEMKNEINRKVADQVKLKIQLFRKEEAMRLQEVKKGFEENEQKYKEILKCLVYKIKQMRNYCSIKDQQNQQKITVLRQFINKLCKSFQSYKQNKQNINSQNSQLNQKFFKNLLQKISSLLNQSSNSNNSCIPSPKNLINSSQKQKGLQSYTQAIDQMFYKSYQFILGQQKNLSEDTLQTLVQKLILAGFFSEENQDNIMKLIALGRGFTKTISSQNTISECANYMLSNGLYPLIIQKIKITMQKLSNSVLSSQTPKQLSQLHRPPLDHSSYLQKTPPIPHNIKQPSSTNSKNQHNMKITPVSLIRYRNIDSIQELQVSDSFMNIKNFEKEDDGDIFEYNDDRYEKEKQIQLQEQNEFNHSPIRNYEGYETSQKDIMEQERLSEGSSSFDIDNLE